MIISYILLGMQDDVHTFCRSRGADGLAFVIQDSKSGLKALGSGGSGKLSGWRYTSPLLILT